jgi:competence ComEA-like helix-hairpin-helix protein
MGIIRKVYFILVLVALVSFMGGLAGAEEKAKININMATAEELSTLKEIGEKKAASIIEYRENHGHFTKIDNTCASLFTAIAGEVKHTHFVSQWHKYIPLIGNIFFE